MRLIDPARSRVVIVGTPTYTDPGLPDVPAVASNVADFAALMTDPQLGGFDPAHCVTAPPGASVGDIGGLLVEAAEAAEDLLLFYYSGHGLLGSRRRELYLSVTDTRPDRLAYTALPFDAIRESCLESRAASRVVILDCCFGGRAIGETLAAGDDAVMGEIEVNGTYTLTAAPGNRTALVLPGERNTAFTGRMLDLLRSGLPDAGDMLSLGAMYRHLYARSRAEGLPLPQQRGTETADLLCLVRNRYGTVPTPAPVRTPAATGRAPVVVPRPRSPLRLTGSSPVVVDNPTSADITGFLRRMTAGAEEFIILDQYELDAMFMQSTPWNDGFMVQYREGADEFFGTEVPDIDAVDALLNGWMFNRPDWRAGHQWEKAD